MFMNYVKIFQPGALSPGYSQYHGTHPFLPVLT